VTEVQGPPGSGPAEGGPHERGTSVIETDGLRKTFGSTVAVDDLSLSVGPGEIFGFLGPNGAGKTTSIKMLLALVTPSEGRGAVLGRPLGDRTVRARIGFLPEHFRFHDCLTGRELLRFHGRLHRMRGLDLEARIDTLLARVDLIDAADRRIRGYSKGMLQRIGLAQALIHDPDLVFLDEPTSGLDPEAVVELREDIAGLARDGATVFLNTHNLTDAEKLADLVGVMRAGKLLALGTPAELRARSETTVTIAGRNLQRAAGEAPATTLLYRLPADGSVAPIVRELVERGGEIEEVRRETIGLEDVFLQIVREEQP